MANCQRRVSRRKKGSHRRRKAVCWLAKAHQTVQRHRQDFHHKTARALVQTYDTIYYEDLQVRNMVKNHHLAKSISDAGWSAFLTILNFKAANAGRSVHAVDPAFTSQACSGANCGVLVQKGLSLRPAYVRGVWREPAAGPQRGAQYAGAGQEHQVGGGTA